MEMPAPVLAVLFLLPLCCGLFPPPPSEQQTGCAYDGPLCPTDFECVNNTCSIQVSGWIPLQRICEPAPTNCRDTGCEIINGFADCRLKNVRVQGPADKSGEIARRTQIFQKQYDFLVSYLGFDPDKSILQMYPYDISDYCEGVVSGCSIGDSTYWPATTLDMPRTIPIDHELNHAFVSDIWLDSDFNEAQARYLTQKEDAYFNGYGLDYYLMDYLKIAYERDHTAFYTSDEKDWLSISTAEEACKKVSDVRDSFGQNQRTECQYLYTLIKYDRQGMLQYLLKNAYEKKIDLTTKEKVDAEISYFIDNCPLAVPGPCSPP